MKIIVLKFGGTSLDTKPKRIAVCNVIKQKIKNDFFPVIIVSAMGRDGDIYSTDSLNKLISSDNFIIKDFTLSCGEMLAAAVIADDLQNISINALPLTGWQAGIITKCNKNETFIKNINTIPIMNIIKNNIIPVVCGYQGIDENGNITTLSRGGSDVTAAYIAHALKAESLQIYKDVDGVYSADPNIVESAVLLESISYNELAEITGNGAKVVHSHASEFAAKHKIPLYIANTLSGKIGTVVKDYKSQRPVTAVTNKSELSLFSIAYSSKNTPSDVFNILANNSISIDFINVTKSIVSFVVFSSVESRVLDLLKDFDPYCKNKLTKISVIGNGMTGMPGVMAKLASILNSAKIEILLATDSYSTISVLVDSTDEINALNLLHKKFVLLED